ncbi:MAG: TMEM43 family protein, partial [Akkermansiaceae bacterium]
MSDSFTETTSEGWLGRIGSSIKGVLIGLIMIVAAFPVLFWNEGRAVKTRKDLDQGSKEFVSLESTEVNAANEGKLVHLTGMTVAEGERKDSEFNVSAEGLVLKRKVEMFQWHEDVDSKSKKKLGGSKETTKTYTYKKAWGEGRIDSSKFNQANDHVNPSLTLSSQSWTASPITVGGFTLSESLVGKINQSTAYPIEKKNKLPNKIQDRKVKLSGGQIYLAKNPSSPQVGDVRISYQVVKPTEVSIVSKQVGN